MVGSSREQASRSFCKWNLSSLSGWCCFIQYASRSDIILASKITCFFANSMANTIDELCARISSAMFTILYSDHGDFNAFPLLPPSHIVVALVLISISRTVYVPGIGLRSRRECHVRHDGERSALMVLNFYVLLDRAREDVVDLTYDRLWGSRGCHLCYRYRVDPTRSPSQ